MDAEATARFQSALEMRRAVRNAVPLAEMSALLGAGVVETKMQRGKIEAANPDIWKTESLSS